jgi:DNA polymerase-3 subunit alpha
MDCWEVERAILQESIEKAIQVGTKFHQNQSSGQTDLFSLLDDVVATEDYVHCKPWATKKRLDGEKETLGLYLTGHPVTPYQQEFAGFTKPIAKLSAATSKKATICGLVKSLRHIMTKRGKKLTIMSLEDASANLDIVVFSEVFEPQQAHISAGQIILVEGELGEDDYTGGLKMLATALYCLHEARTRFAKCLAMTLSADDQGLLPTIQSVLKAHQGECVVQVRYSNPNAKAAINLASEWRVKPSDELLASLTDILAPHCVEICY